MSVMHTLPGRRPPGARRNRLGLRLTGLQALEAIAGRGRPWGPPAGAHVPGTHVPGTVVRLTSQAEVDRHMQERRERLDAFDRALRAAPFLVRGMAEDLLRLARDGTPTRARLVTECHWPDATVARAWNAALAVARLHPSFGDGA